MNEFEPISEPNSAENSNKSNVNSEPNRKFCRKNDSRLIAGVCSGISEYLGISVTVIRSIFVVLLLFGGWGALIYGAVVLLVPYCGENSASSESRTDSIIKPLAIAFAAILIFYSFFESYSFNMFSLFGVFSKSFILGFSLIVIGIFLFRAAETASRVDAQQDKLSLGQTGIFLGVCEGIAEYFSADKAIIRIVWLTFSFITFGAGALIYIIIYFNLKGKE